MAFYDWNNNGKKDIQDDFIEYNIYKKCTNDDSSNNYSNNNNSSNFGCGVWGWISIILIVLGLLSKCGG